MMNYIAKHGEATFLGNGELYFYRFGRLMSCSFDKEIDDYNMKKAKEVVVDQNIISTVFFQTDRYVSNVMMEIGIGKVRESLTEGYPVMLSVEERAWYFTVEDDDIFIDPGFCFETQEEIDDYFKHDMARGFFDGHWYILDMQSIE